MKNVVLTTTDKIRGKYITIDYVFRVCEKTLIAPNGKRIRIERIVENNGTCYLNGYGFISFKNENDKLYFTKIVNHNKRIANMELDFDGEITSREIRNIYGNDYCVRCYDGRIAFYKMLSPNQYTPKPTMSICIRPVRKESCGDGTLLFVFNKRLFDTKMAKYNH